MPFCPRSCSAITNQYPHSQPPTSDRSFADDTLSAPTKNRQKLESRLHGANKLCDHVINISHMPIRVADESRIICLITRPAPRPSDPNMFESTSTLNSGLLRVWPRDEVSFSPSLFTTTLTKRDFPARHSFRFDDPKVRPLSSLKHHPTLAV